MPGQEGPESRAGEAGSQPGAPPGTGAQVGPPLFPCEPQSPFTLHHCLEERPRDCLNLVPVPTPSPGPGARAALLEALWCHLDACGAPVTERDRPSPASQVAQPWLLRGRSLESQAAPRTFSLHQDLAEGCTGRLPEVGGGGAPQTPRQQRSGPCAPGGRVRAPEHLGIPGSRTCYQSRLARLRGGGNTPPPLRLPAPHGQAPPSRALGPGAPPPGNVCPKNRSLPREPRLGRCRRVKSKAGPGRPGSAGWRRPPKPARNPRGRQRPAWLGAHCMVAPNGSCPVPSALQRPQVYVSALPARRRRAVPTSSEALCGLFSRPPQPPFPSSPAAPLSSLPWATAVMVACSPRSPQRLFPSNASPAAPGLKTQLS